MTAIWPISSAVLVFDFFPFLLLDCDGPYAVHSHSLVPICPLFLICSLCKQLAMVFFTPTFTTDFEPFYFESPEQRRDKLTVNET